MSDLTVEQQYQAAKLEAINTLAVPVANVIEMVASTVLRVAGKDIADSIGDESLTRSVLNNMIANRLKEKLLG